MLTRKRQINENGPTPPLHCSKEPTEEEVTTPDSNPNGPTVEFKLVEDVDQAYDLELSFGTFETKKSPLTVLAD